MSRCFLQSPFQKKESKVQVEFFLVIFFLLRIKMKKVFYSYFFAFATETMVEWDRREADLNKWEMLAVFFFF